MERKFSSRQGCRERKRRREREREREKTLVIRDIQSLQTQHIHTGQGNNSALFNSEMVKMELSNQTKRGSPFLSLGFPLVKMNVFTLSQVTALYFVLCTCSMAF